MATPEQLEAVIGKWAEIFMHSSMGDFKRYMVKAGLSYTQVIILMRLFHGNKVGITELGGHLGITNAATSQAVDQLVNDGLIKRMEDPGDRRAKLITLTEEGRTLIKRGIDIRSQEIAELTKAFSNEQRELIISALTLLIDEARKLNA